MEATNSPSIDPVKPVNPRTDRRSAAEASAVWLLAFALTVYVGLSDGGYDIVVRSQIGILIWWLLLLGLIVGVLPRSRWPAPLWVGFALLTAYFGWTWLGATWTSSVEQTLIEVSRVATYIGGFALAASILSRATGRALLCGLAAGIAVVCAIAIVSKLLPSLYPTNPANRFYLTPRLSYPFDYSDGVGEFAALGIPLLWYVASSARSLWGRALGGAGLPVVLLCVGMTVSRGGILAAAVSVVVFLALSPDRLQKLVSGVIAALAIVVLMAALISRHALAEGLKVAPAAQRHSMLLILVVVLLVAAILQAGVAVLGRRRGRPAWSRPSRRAGGVTGVLILALFVGAVIAFFATGAAHTLWEEFKQPTVPKSSSTYFRLASVAGSHRYQYWQVALHAFESSPWKGIGPGTFQFYWAQHQTLGEYVLNAHSLWIETLAELGVIGVVLLAGFFLWTLIAGAVRALSAETPNRALRTAAVAGVAAFCAAAAFDWDWQIGVIPLITMFLAAICLSEHRSAQDRALKRLSAKRSLTTRAVLAVASLVALWAIFLPLSTTTAVRASQQAASQGRLILALRDAGNAQWLEPSAATPRLQRALVLEQLGDVNGAAQAINGAVRRSPTDWALWLVASRIATEQNRPGVALRDYRQARQLNPRSPIFGG